MFSLTFISEESTYSTPTILPLLIALLIDWAILTGSYPFFSTEASTTLVVASDIPFSYDPYVDTDGLSSDTVIVFPNAW